LRKIRIGEDIHCSQSTSLQQQLELIPDKDQLIFEGDSLTLICRAPRIALSMRDHEDFALKSNVYWGWSEKIVPPNSKEDLFIENPKDKFPSVLIDEKVISNLGILQSVLKIPYVTRNHSGLYDCTMQQQKGESLAKRVSVLVISDKTKYCLAQETSDNKGRFSWPRTIRGNTVKLPCSIEGVASSIASRKCNENGSWEEIDASNCPFIHETTRVLEQFSKVNLTIPRGNVLESAKRLMAFTAKEFIKERFRDPMDVVFIGKTVESYIEFIHMEKDLSSFIMEIVSNVMEFPKSLLDQAQILDRTSSKLIDAAEKAASHTTSAESQKSNLAIELFQIPNDIYVGISCSWIKQENSKQFLCNTASKSHPNFANIDASIQFPATQYSGSQTHRLLVSVYNNNKFFHQNKSQGSYLVTSNIIGAKLVPPTMMSSMIPKNLSEPIFIALKAAPFHDEISQPKVVWWDESMNDGTGGWSFNHGCQSFHYIQGIFMFTCNRLGFYALVQHSSALNDFLNEDSGARFKLSPIGFYVGTLIIFFTAWLNIVTYIFFFDRIIMGRRVKHSLINTWISMAMLAFIFAVGIYQTENSKVCQFFGVTIHYLSLCVLLWICVSVSNMYKRVSRNDRIGMEDELPREEPRVKKPILGLYLLGYGVGLLICGINSAVNLKEYASYTHCFMDTSSELGALLLPSSILLFFLLIMFICIRFHLRNRVICNTHLSEGGTEALEIDLLESSHAVNAARSVRSFSTQPTHTSLEDLEASPRTQLKSYIIVLVLYLLTWLSAAVAVSIPFNERLIYEEEIFSIAFAIFSMLLGCFISFFYGFARSDVRSIWSQFKCCGKIQKTIVPKEYEQTTTTSVMYHQPMNLSRSNSQNSRGRPLSVGSIRLKSANDLNDTMSKSNGGNFMMTMQRHQMSVYSDDTSTVEMFYNPNQSNAARRFFKKQKRLQKLNNIDVQRRCDFNDNSSDISSTIMSVSKPVSEMFGTSSKVNNTNIHVDENKMKNKQFSNSVMSDSCNESELFMDICNEGLRFSTLKSKINNTDSKMYTNFFENQSTIQEVLKKKIEEKQKSSLETSKDVDPPLYMNTRSLVGKTIQGKKVLVK
jgi:adhesion G protein-coupled receptor A3